MKLVILACFMMLSVMFSTSVNAAFHCSADINRILIYGNGTVNIRHSGRNDFTVICDLNNEWKGVSVTTCAMWTAMLQNIKKNNGKAIFYYGGEGTCAALPTYGSTPAPVYIGDI
ncbi:hypothetical protein [Shewanella nanhaiensis]|uniref:Uncharacterized protein n=1 Tax=Shewanella nanhaiensis TaxID=2864872 RepID=A0ABS7E3T3_9GAMM|nr:hypothetical protein [Shewanella nanhaiensis]MBW8184290.1 hypothetical protein [Shewanella nanhaiensis]